MAALFPPAPRCFNEARADSPGRLTPTPWGNPGVGGGFNEARADSPGRFSRVMPGLNMALRLQ